MDDLIVFLNEMDDLVVPTMKSDTNTMLCPEMFLVSIRQTTWKTMMH
jgi:hypothetical protein